MHSIAMVLALLLISALQLGHLKPDHLQALLGLADLGATQFVGLLGEGVVGLPSAPERLEHPDAVHRLLHRGGHRHGAGDVLPRVEAGLRHPGVRSDGGVDVDGIELRIGEQRLVAVETPLHAELIAHLLQALLVALADRVHLGVRMPLVDGDELDAESEADQKELFAKIGKLEMENDFLKKKLIENRTVKQRKSLVDKDHSLSVRRQSELLDQLLKGERCKDRHGWEGQGHRQCLYRKVLSHLKAKVCLLHPAENGTELFKGTKEFMEYYNNRRHRGIQRHRPSQLYFNAA